jgi:uncharacterized membrane-anchored protein
MNKALRFWLILVLQAVLILAIPAQAFYTQLSGRAIVLQTAPVDPYSLFQGYSVTLSYDISNAQNLQKLPGWKEVAAKHRADEKEFYVVLQAPDDVTGRPPKAWKAISVASRYPDKLQANQIALRGRDLRGRIAYGLETYFMPEDQRDAINQEINNQQINQAGESAKPAFVVEVKVGSGGNAVPIAIWLKDKRYEF